MLKKILTSIFNKKIKSDKIVGSFLIVQLNEKVMPIDRGLVYEDPIVEFLKNKQYGEVTGGGTFQQQTGEIAMCDIHIQLSSNDIDKTVISNIIDKIENLGAPKGSKLIIERTNEEISFGKKEGLVLYIDGQNLPEEVYAECDINFVISEVYRITNIVPNAERNWQGEKETALYFYSDSYEQMKNSISEFIDNYPLCKGARIVQIA